MLIALWIINALLALVFIAAGAMKALRPREALVESGMGWAADFRPGSVTLIGVLEILGGVGLILPLLIDTVPILTPIAAVALAIVMIVATVVHARRSEKLVPTVALAVLSAVSAVLGFLVVLG